MFEKVILNHLSDYLELKKFIRTNQYGVGNHHSTVLTSLHLDYLNNEMDHIIIIILIFI